MSTQTEVTAQPAHGARRGCRQKTAATCAAFQDELLRERARSDRTQQLFSVVMFEVPRTRRGNELADLLSHIVPERMRATDFMGWFDLGHLAVILDNCLVCSALSFGNEICRRVSQTMRPPNRMIVQTFPAQFDKELDEEAGKGEGPLGTPAGAQVHCDGGCPEVCLQKTGFLPGTITVEYKALPGIQMRPAISARPLPAWKRCVDVLVALLGLVLASPLFLLAFICLKLSTRESALFAQERVGFLGRPFSMLKFRTMSDARISTHREAMRRLIQNADTEEPMVPVKTEEEQRVTKLGWFLRKSGIDELPQLVNILRGEMSLVGPRPPIPYEVEVYERWHSGRLDAVPGMTGLWQVSGMNRLSFREMARLDIYYSRNMSLWLDIKILARTPLAVMGEVVAGMRERGKKISGGEEESARKADSAE